MFRQGEHRSVWLTLPQLSNVLDRHVIDALDVARDGFAGGDESFG